MRSGRVLSISDSLYKLERATNDVRSDVSDSTASIKTAVNSTDLVMENKVIEIFRLSFNAKKATYAAFTSTVNFTVRRGFSERTSAFVKRVDRHKKFEEFREYLLSSAMATV